MKCVLLVAVLVASLPLGAVEVDGWSWQWPSAYLKRPVEAPLPKLPDIGNPDMTGHDGRTGWFALEHMGIVRLKDGDRPFEYLRKGTHEYLRSFLAELREQAAVARELFDRTRERQMAAGETLDRAKPYFLLHEARMETYGDMVCVRYLTETEGVFGAKALMLLGNEAVSVQFLDEANDRVLSELRLENFLMSVEADAQ